MREETMARCCAWGSRSVLTHGLRNRPGEDLLAYSQLTTVMARLGRSKARAEAESMVFA